MPAYFVLNAATGAEVWKYQAGVREWASPAVANGVVYTGSTDGNLYAFNARTAQRRWSFPVGAGLDSAPSVANGVVYIGANSQQRVYALDAGAGRKLWSYSLSSAGPNERVQSSPAVADGALYVNAGERIRIRPVGGSLYGPARRQVASEAQAGFGGRI